MKGTILTVETGNTKAQNYLIYNMLGQTVLEGTFTKTINVQSLESGVYMLKVNTQNARFVVE